MVVVSQSCAARMLEMESDIRKEIFLFDGQSDFTFLEVKAWKSAMYSIVIANQSYCEKMEEAAGVLSEFSGLCRSNAIRGKHSQSAAESISQLLTKISELHKEVFGDLVKYTDPQGPFGDLIKSSDYGFVLLQKKAILQFEEHEKLEKTAAKAWKYYLRRVKKMKKLEVKLAKTLTCEEMRQNNKFSISKRKVDVALSRYNICFDNEIRQREGLAEQTVALKKEFVKEEKLKLQTLFSFISDSVLRLKRLAPQGLEYAVDNMNLEQELTKTKSMARAGWELHLTQHTFPERKGCKQTSKHNDDDEDEDEDSDDEDEEDEDADNETADVSTNVRGGLTQRRVRSLDAPRLNNNDSGMNDVHQEILESLDDEIKETSHIRRKSPEPCPQTAKERSRDSSSDSEKLRSQDSSPIFRRQRPRASSPVSRKRKPLKENPRTRKSRSPDLSQEVRKEGACDSSQESRKDRACDSSSKHRKQKSSDPSPEAVVAAMTTGATSSSPSRGKSMTRESMRRRKNDDGSSVQRSQSHSEARRRRHQSADESQSTDVHDFQAVEEFEHPPVRSQNQWFDSPSGSPTPEVNAGERCMKTEEKTAKEVTSVEGKVGLRSESRRRRRAAKETKEANDETSTATSQDNKPSENKVSAPRDLPLDNAVHVVRQTDVTVYVLQGRQKQTSREISIRAGMKLKQLRFSEAVGMAYGYKMTTLGLRKYGYYPASFVSLEPPDQANKTPHTSLYHFIANN